MAKLVKIKTTKIRFFSSKIVYLFNNSKHIFRTPPPVIEAREDGYIDIAWSVETGFKK